jgi:hypothetical protein
MVSCIKKKLCAAANERNIKSRSAQLLLPVGLQPQLVQVQTPAIDQKRKTKGKKSWLVSACGGNSTSPITIHPTASPQSISCPQQFDQNTN